LIIDNMMMKDTMYMKNEVSMKINQANGSRSDGVWLNMTLE